MTECDWVEVTGRGGVGGEGAVQQTTADNSRQQQTTVTTAAVLQHDHVKCDDESVGRGWCRDFVAKLENTTDSWPLLTHLSATVQTPHRPVTWAGNPIYSIAPE